MVADGAAVHGSGVLPTLFGPTAGSFASLFDSFAAMSESRSYRITSQAEFAALESVGERNRIYSSEILYRAHFAAAAALLRLREWFIGARRALDDRNVLVLAAAIRGYLEAVADTVDALADVPGTLADGHVVLRRAITGQLTDRILLLPETESDLIHFAYARRLEPGEEAPRLHGAKSAADTVSVLEESIPDVRAVYGLLCQYSHPSAHTVFRFARPEIDKQLLTFDPRAGSDALAELVAMSDRIGPALMAAGVAPCVMTLKVLNRLGVTAVSTPWAESITLGFSQAWQTIRKRLLDPSEPYEPSEDERSRITSELFAAYEPAKRKRRGSQ